MIDIGKEEIIGMIIMILLDRNMSGFQGLN